MQEAISGVKGGVCLEERREALQKNTLAKKKIFINTTSLK